MKKERHQRFILICRKVQYVSAEEGFITFVRVDTFKTKDEAEKWAKILKSSYKGNFITTTIKSKYNETRR